MALTEILKEDSSLERLRAHGLLDENDEPTSVGSILHDERSCKPCVAAHAGKCEAGIFCTCCHRTHNRAAITRQRNAMRACKGKRTRERNLLRALE